MSRNSVRPVTKADRAPIILNCREADTWREVRQCLTKAGYPVIGACEVASAQAARCSRVSLAPPLKMEETEALRALCTSRTHKEAEWDRRQAVVDQRRQIEAMYLSAFDAAVSAITTNQGRRNAREALVAELDVAWVRLKGDLSTRVETLARKKLTELDASLIAELKQNAEKAISERRYADAGSFCRQLLLEYHDPDTQRWGTEKLLQATKLAALEWKAQADPLYRKQDYAGARPLYEKMLAEIADGENGRTGQREAGCSAKEELKELKIYALARIGRALREAGDENGARQRLTEALSLAEATPLSAIANQKLEIKNGVTEATYTLALTLGGNVMGQTRTNRQRWDSIPLFEKVAKEYPDSEFAPKALYMIAMIYFWTGKKPEAQQYFAKVAADYPASTLFKQAQIYAQALNKETSP